MRRFAGPPAPPPPPPPPPLRGGERDYEIVFSHLLEILTNPSGTNLDARSAPAGRGPWMVRVKIYEAGGGIPQRRQAWRDLDQHPVTAHAREYGEPGRERLNLNIRRQQ